MEQVPELLKLHLRRASHTATEITLPISIQKTRLVGLRLTSNCVTAKVARGLANVFKLHHPSPSRDLLVFIDKTRIPVLTREAPKPHKYLMQLTRTNSTALSLLLSFTDLRNLLQKGEAFI